MAVEKSSEKSPIPYGLYRLDHDYVRAMKKSDDRVLDPEENDLYCGPVFHSADKRGVTGWFVPIDFEEYKASGAFLMVFMDGIFAQIFDFRKMLPVVDKRFITPVTEPQNIINFCTKAQSELEECADALMKAKREKNGYPFLTF